MHQFFAPAEPALEQHDGPSRMVQESTVSTPRGQHVQVTLERVSTGGTRHQAQFERASTGPMSGAERMKKQRARCSLFPETQASAREKDAERVAARRAAAGELMDVDEEAEEERESAAWSAVDVMEHTVRMRRVRDVWREHPQLEVSQLDVAAEHALMLEEQVHKDFKDGCHCPCYMCNHVDEVGWWATWATEDAIPYDDARFWHHENCSCGECWGIDDC